MKLENLELLRLLPQFMQDDATFRSFCLLLADEIRLIQEDLKLIRLYLNLDDLSETILDMLAEQFSIVEYNKTYPAEVKRDLIRNCFEIHHKRGTAAAVEEAVTKIFGNATVEEWFDYGGKPYHFKVKSENIWADDEIIDRFKQTVEKTKSIRSHLEKIILEFKLNQRLYTGHIIHEAASVEHKMHADLNFDIKNNIYACFKIYNASTHIYEMRGE